MFVPALNIRFTDEEIERLRERARNKGLSMRTLAHDTIVNCNDQAEEDALIWAAYRRGRDLRTHGIYSPVRGE
jgi:hypothetical protein